MSLIEILNGNHEFEQTPVEKERTYLPLFPERLAGYRAEAVPIAQYYLSGTQEPCDLRMREITKHDGSVRYEVGLKGDERFIDRTRVRTEPIPGLSIPKELFDYYTAGTDLPVVHKLRAKPNAHVDIDFYADGAHVEVEDPIAGSAFFDRTGGMASFVDITGDRSASNRWRAEISYRQTHSGAESLAYPAELNSDAMVGDILRARLETITPLIVTVSGRSGSGKTTLIRELREKLAAVGLTSDVTSTDDYHRGKTWLELQNNGQPWERWDDEIVYNLRALAEDLAAYREGGIIPRLRMNWVTEDPEVAGTIRPIDVLIVEGIYAGSLEIAPYSNLEYELPTPFATCVWRRLLRDLNERPEFADPEKSLRYILEQAEPAYRAQKLKRAAAERAENASPDPR